MKSNQKLSRTIAAILSASAAHAVFAAGAAQAADAPQATAAATSTTATTTGTLQEVIVTAQRREQNIQNVPISIQALTGTTLKQLNVQTFEDYVKYLPNVSTGTMGPGQGTVFMRGLSVGVLGTQGQGSVGGFPNVAVYLDDQSAIVPGRNLDIYAVDLQRIEILEGPQGTLFGAGAEAGVVRYITNKPVLDATEVDVTAGYGVTAHGDPNSKGNAVFNIPLINDKLAARVAVFTDHRGGYINNLPAYFKRGSTDLGIENNFGGVVPANSVVINNYNMTGNAINPVSYQGIRGELLFKINDDWDVLVSQMYQDMNAQGVFYEMPFGSEGAGLTSSGAPIGGQPLPPYSVNLFNPSFDRDKFENTALTVDGKIGPLSLVYTGAYLVRNVEQVQDYTNYARGVYGVYYQCTNVYNQSAGVTCYSPSSVWSDNERNTHLSQELRVSTPSDWRLRGIAGLYWEDYKLYDDTEWLYKSVPQCAPGGPTVDCFLPIQPWQDGPANRPGLRNPNTGFFDDFQRTFIQKAAYLSADFDIIPHKLTITGGIRYFDMYNASYGGDVGSFYCYQYTPTTYFGACPAPYGTDFAKQNPHQLVQTGKRGRADLSWHVTPDKLLYYTYSQGFRPGGFNRGSSSRLPDANGVAQYETPLFYVSDDLTNNEVGWKTQWLGNHVQFNGALYQENWSNAQVGFFCPQCGLGNLTFGTNGPDYRVRGVELQLAARLMTGLTVQGSAAWNSGQLVNSPALRDNNPKSPNYGKPITTYYKGGVATPLEDVYGQPGSPLANSPPFEANLRLRYDWLIGNYAPFVQVGAQHQSHSQSAAGHVESYDQPAWTTYDASAGVSKDSWTVSLVGTNITNTNASLFTSSRQFILTETPMRPRVIELTFGYSFTSK
ncbi:MAG TPA: TonB-dependent receptor [Steroidobacteraceae bacterium]|nr:TonB-dependent receptor [Steroidobacteraceae bacterium]